MALITLHEDYGRGIQNQTNNSTASYRPASPRLRLGVAYFLVSRDVRTQARLSVCLDGMRAVREGDQPDIAARHDASDVRLAGLFVFQQRW